jgi:hypothetical protein
LRICGATVSFSIDSPQTTTLINATDPDAKHAATKVLAKWRPYVLQEQPNGAGAVGAIKTETKIEPKA